MPVGAIAVLLLAAVLMVLAARVDASWRQLLGRKFREWRRRR
jgi:hypothetical protein